MSQKTVRTLTCNQCGTSTDGTNWNWVHVHRVGYEESSHQGAVVFGLADPGDYLDFCGYQCLWQWATERLSPDPRDRETCE